jgi:hypothetical protein
MDFDAITNIRGICQPGILNRRTFFNSAALRKALKEVCWDFSRDEILVYFRNIAGGMQPNDRERKGNWQDSFEQFVSYLKNIPGKQLEYWYHDGGKARASPELNTRNAPYQAFARLFDNAVQAFSCFVGGSQAGMSFSSDRSNYETIKPGEALVMDHMTLWKGTPNALLNSAYRIQDALERMSITHNIGISGHNGYRAEMRIIARLGALADSLVDDGSVTLHVSHASLEKIVEERERRHRQILGALKTS